MYLCDRPNEGRIVQIDLSHDSTEVPRKGDCIAFNVHDAALLDGEILRKPEAVYEVGSVLWTRSMRRGGLRARVQLK